MKDSFNANFYIVTATVIPVLFLAFILQSPLIERLKKTSARKKEVGPDWQHLAAVSTLSSVGQITLIFGVLGELYALRALLDQHATSFTRHFVYYSTFALLVEVAAIPAFTVYGTYLRAWGDIGKTIYSIITDRRDDFDETSIKEPQPPTARKPSA